MAKSWVKWEHRGPHGDESKWGSIMESLELHEKVVVLFLWTWGLRVVEVEMSDYQPTFFK